MDDNGIKDELPPITTFLNRLLALTIELQGILFTAFEQLARRQDRRRHRQRHYDVGLETLTGGELRRHRPPTIYTHPGTGAETRLLTITERERNRPMTRSTRRWPSRSDPGRSCWSTSAPGRAAVQVPLPR
jgi:hypothetical protein